MAKWSVLIRETGERREMVELQYRTGPGLGGRPTQFPVFDLPYKYNVLQEKHGGPFEVIAVRAF
jgi:hypothetical protein